MQSIINVFIEALPHSGVEFVVLLLIKAWHGGRRVQV